MRSFLKVKTVLLLGGPACLLLSAGLSMAQQVPANGLIIQPRFFNDFKNSTETITINGGAPLVNPPAGVNIPVSSLPASVTINDSNLTNTPASGFANRDDLLISTDHGATAFTGNINGGFTISANITLSDGANAPRKEAGIRVNSSVSGDALFILDTDSGEIVAFGAGAPFYSFRPAIEASYIPGQTIFMKEQYVPGPGGTTGANPGTMEYWAQLLPSGPLLDSGPLFYSNLEGGPTNPQIGFYDQAPDGTTTAADFVNAQFNNIQATVPEPASLGMLLVGGITLLARRRTARLV